MLCESQVKIIPVRTPESQQFVADVERAMAITPALNRLTYADADQIRSLFEDLAGNGVGDQFRLIPPFYVPSADALSSRQWAAGLVPAANGARVPSPDLPVLTFPDAEAFENWLAAQPKTAAGAWLTFSKPRAPEATLSKSDAIDSALIYGWIDGQLGRMDAHYYKVRFTPRKARSAWSQVNRGRVERLIAEGRMKPGGLAEVTRAKADGRWDAAYAPQGRATPDPDLLAALDAQPRARRFFDSLDAANRFGVLYRVHQAKPEKRAAKIAEIVARLASGEAFHTIRKRRA